MSDKEILCLYEAAMAGSLSEDKGRAIATRAAQHAEGKDWKAYLTSIDSAVSRLVTATRRGDAKPKQDVDGFFGKVLGLPRPGSRLSSGKKAVGVNKKRERPVLPPMRMPRPPAPPSAP